MRTGSLEALDRQLSCLGVGAAVADLLGPGREEVVQLLQARDAAMARLGEEGFADVAVEPLLLAPALWLSGQSWLRKIQPPG